MYRPGHQGAALIAYAPLGLTLVVLARPTLAVVGGGLSLALASLPDVDQRLPGVTHRGGTHTLGFAVAVGTVLGGAGWLVGGVEPAAVGFAVGTTTVVSHLLADVITPMGIKPFWPLSTRHYTLDICRAENTLANYALLGAGVAVTVAVLAAAR